MGSCGARVALTSEACLKGLPKVGSQSFTNISTNTNLSGATSSSFNAGQITTSSNNQQHYNSNFPSSTTGSGGSGIGSNSNNYYNHYTSSTNPNDVADFKVCLFFINIIYLLF